MVALRPDIAGNDIYGKMNGFMLSREALDGQPNLRAFMDAQSNQKPVAFNGDAVLSQEEMLLMKSGYVDASPYSRAAESGKVTRGESEESEDSQKAKEARLTRALINSITSQTMSYAGMTFTYEQVNNNLSIAMAEQKKFLERDLPEVKKDDLMYVDNNGKIVTADQPGARQVVTLEEKTAIENANGVCTIKKAGDEVAFGDGKMVLNEDITKNMAIQDAMDTVKDTQQKLQSGEMRLSEVPDNIKEMVKQVEETGSLTAVKQDTGPGILGQLEQEAAQSKLVREYKEKMGISTPEPTYSPALAPNI